MSGDLPDGLFTREGDTFVPHTVTAGPWSVDAMHGGPATALTGRVLDGWQNDERGWVLGRLTIELIRPVPVKPLRVRIEPRRLGRKLQVLDAVVVGPDDTEVSLVRAVRVRVRDIGVDERTLAPPPAGREVRAPEDCAVTTSTRGQERPPLHIFTEAMELRPAVGDLFLELGPAAIWMRPRCATFAGEPLSPLDRLLQCSDWGNGFSNVLDFDRYTFVNGDLTVSIHHLPVGEWILVDAASHVRREGHGQALAQLRDQDRAVAMAAQTLVIDAR